MRTKIIFLLLFVVSCSLPIYPPNKVEIYTPQDEKGNFFFEVGQESKIDPLDIVIYIDDEKILDGKYYNSREGAHFINFDEYLFNLEEGDHTIKAESKLGNANIETAFQVDNKTYAFLVYRDFKDTPQFIFNYQTEPFYRD